MNTHMRSAEENLYAPVSKWKYINDETSHDGPKYVNSRY